MRPIDADVLREHTFQSPKYKQIGGRRNGKTLENINLAYQTGWNDAISAVIENAPTIEERPKGKWGYTTRYGRRYRMCSNCYTEREDDNTTWYFCPNCGAEMKGDEK